MTHPTHAPAAAPAELDVLGLRIRILLHGAETGGAVALCEERTPPHWGPPMHVHDDADEFFRVLDGRYRFRVGDATVEAGPGHVLFVPRGTPHCFVNALDTPGRLFFGLTPGGCEGFFEDVAARGLTAPADMPAILETAGRFALRMVGPNPFLPH